MSLFWGEDLVAGVSTYADGARFSRGQSLWAQDAVFDLRVQFGRVTAHVDGASEVYECELEVEPFVGGQLSFLNTLSIPTGWSTTLEKLALVLQAHGVSLGPDPRTPAAVSCTCPDDDYYCKHVIALAMTFADLIDDDPTIWLAARGFGRAEVAPEPDREATLEDELATYWVGSPVAPVSGVVRPAVRERDTEVLLNGLLSEFSRPGRRRARALELTTEAVKELSEIFDELTREEPRLPLPRGNEA
jgi:hypothetical protein